MTVLNFSRARLTPQDIDAFNAVAKPRMESGLWSGVSRNTDASGDRITVMFHNLNRPAFLFERDKTGQYTLWFQDRNGWHSIKTGDNADECLSIWTTKPKKLA